MMQNPPIKTLYILEPVGENETTCKQFSRGFRYSPDGTQVLYKFEPGKGTPDCFKTKNLLTHKQIEAVMKDWNNILSAGEPQPKATK